MNVVVTEPVKWLPTDAVEPGEENCKFFFLQFCC